MNKNPYASIVILTLGDAPKVIECLKKQTFQDFEIIFAREKGIVHAMNCALKTAKGEIFIRLDDDVEMPETWLESFLIPFKDPMVAGATGPTFVPRWLRKNRDSIRIWEKPNCFLNWLTDGCKFKPAGLYRCGMVSYDSNYEERFLGMDKLVWSVPDHLEGTNWAMRTDLIRYVGGFDSAFDGVAEWFDTDVEHKVKKMVGKWRFVYNPKAYLYHLLEFTEHYNDRFDGWGRIKNFIRFHARHSKFHYKMVIYLMVWVGYFVHSWVKTRIKKIC